MIVDILWMIVGLMAWIFESLEGMRHGRKRPKAYWRFVGATAILCGLLGASSEAVLHFWHLFHK